MQRIVTGVLLSLSLHALAPSAAALQAPAAQREAVQPAQPAAQPTAPGAWARYLPPRTIALFSARSTDAVLAVGEQFAAAVGQPMGMNAPMLLQMVLPFECDVSLIDTAREVHFALVLEQGAFEPMPCFFLPSADPARLAASIAPQTGFSATAQEGFAIVSNVPLPAQPSAAPHALASQLLQGQVAVQVDLETLITTFRPMIDMGLMQAEQMAPTEMQGVDAWLEEGLAFVREALDVSKGLGFALRLEKSELEIDARYTMEEGSSFAGIHGNKVRALAAHRDLLDPNASVIALSNIDYEAYAAPLIALTRRMIDPLTMSLANGASEAGEGSEAAQLAEFDRMLAMAHAVMPMYGTLQAWSFDVDAQGGMSFEMHTRGADPAKLAEAQRQWLTWMQSSTLGVGFGADGLKEREVAGRKLLQGRMSLDMSKLAPAQGLGQEEREQAEKMSAAMQSLLYPESAQFSIGSRADELLIVQGDEARLGRALARGAAPVKLEPAFERALANCGAVSPAIAMQLDLARSSNWIGDFVKAMASVEGVYSAMPFDSLPTFSRPFWLTSWAALGSTECSGGVHFDLDELGHFVEAWVAWSATMEAAEPETPPTFEYEIK